MITRTLEDKIKKIIGGKKAILIMGARQVGKSTLLESMFDGKEDILWLNGDDLDTQELFENITSTRLKTILGNCTTLVIDEAQRIKDIGLRIKLVTDQIKNVQVVATGSSSFELASKINESLTGRKREFKMFPLSFKEMVAHTSFLEENRLLPHRLVFGYYPEIVCSPGQELVLLKELTDSYLYKDVLTLDQITKPDKLIRLLKALALQIGSQVSYNEIGQLIGLSSKTVERYIDILEKSYIIFRLQSYAKNLRNELKFSRKIYFWDTGVRNAIIQNFNQIENRNDVGALWENFLIAERLKNNSYSDNFVQPWFWRTQQQNEIDYIEEYEGTIRAFEFKWNKKKEYTKIPKSFAGAYPEAKDQVITPNNIEDFLLTLPPL